MFVVSVTANHKVTSIPTTHQRPRYRISLLYPVILVDIMLAMCPSYRKAISFDLLVT